MRTSHFLRRGRLGARVLELQMPGAGSDGGRTNVLSAGFGNASDWLRVWGRRLLRTAGCRDAWQMLGREYVTG